jgi:hypothetical protein
MEQIAQSPPQNHGAFHRVSPPLHFSSPSVRRAKWMGSLLLAATLAFPEPVRAAFQLPFLTAQSRAMGSAPVVEEKDPAALFTNPAGMAGMDQLEGYFSSSNMFSGLSGVDSIRTGFVAGALPTRYGSLGVGIGIFHAADLLQENTLSVGLARNLFDTVQVGVAGKYLHHSYMPEGDPLAAHDPVFQNGTSRGAFALDLGAAAPLRGPVRFHLAVRNLNEPDVGLVTTDRVKREIEMGSVLKILNWKVTGGLSWLNSRETGLKRLVPSFGLEKSMHDGRVAFRFGASTTEWGGGFGVKVGRVGFDYALILNQNLRESDAMTHTVGMRFQFGGKK